MDLAARILDKLRWSPLSVEELAFDLKRKPYEVRLLINALLREGCAVAANWLDLGVIAGQANRRAYLVNSEPGLDCF